MVLSDNINIATKKGLCLRCGACYAVCPVDAISIDLTTDNYPIVDNLLCTKCGKCLKVCSGMFPDQQPYAQKSLLGTVLNAYIGFSNDAKIRRSSASGGLATSISCYLLSAGIIDGVILVRGNISNALRNEVIIASTSEEVKSCQGSRYSPAYVCHRIRNIDMTKRYAFIGKPCDIQSLHKILTVCPELSKAVIYKIGIFCHHTPNYKSTDQVIDKFGYNKEFISRIQYRGDGWPGYFKIFDNNGDVVFQEKYPVIWSKYLLKIPKRCNFCSDCTAESADISLGDPWNMPQENEGGGKNIILARSRKGEDLIRLLIDNNLITCVKISLIQVLQSSKSLLKKKNSAAYKIILAKIRMNDTPYLKINLHLFFNMAKHISYRVKRIKNIFVSNSSKKDKELV